MYEDPRFIVKKVSNIICFLMNCLGLQCPSYWKEVSDALFCDLNTISTHPRKQDQQPTIFLHRLPQMQSQLSGWYEAASTYNVTIAIKKGDIEQSPYYISGNKSVKVQQNYQLLSLKRLKCPSKVLRLEVSVFNTRKAYSLYFQQREDILRSTGLTLAKRKMFSIEKLQLKVNASLHANEESRYSRQMNIN